MPIPAFKSNGELPPGEHRASLLEVEEVFGTSTDRRKDLMIGLRSAIKNFELAGVNILWLDGSFITNKKDPNDIDGCWEYNFDVDLNILDPVLLGSRKEMKNKYGLDFFVANVIESDSGLPFPKFFQKNSNGNIKGIIVMKLGGVV